MFIATQGTRLFVSSFGAGDRTALALGGWIGSGEMWLPVLGLLSRKWRTVTFDQRGSGTVRIASRGIGSGSAISEGSASQRLGDAPPPPTAANPTEDDDRDEVVPTKPLARSLPMT